MSDHAHHPRRDIIAAAPAPAHGAAAALHVCRSCDAPLVYPVAWTEAGAQHWEVTLRCPGCEWRGTGIYDQDAVERFDEELDRGTELLVRDLRELVRANMEDDVERFIGALRADVVLPEDF